MIEVIGIIFGILFVFFIPGFLLSHIIWKKMKTVERIVMSVVFSMVIVIFLGFLLSGIGKFLGFQGITVTSVWISLIVIPVLMGLYLLTISKSFHH